MRKYRMLRERLALEGGFTFAEAPLATREQIESAHDAEYVAAFLDGRLDAAAMRRIGFPWSPQLVARTLASAGSTLAATVDALRTGIGGTLAGGTHHAFASYGSGYCIFNDIAIAIRTHPEVRPAAVIDLDVHQGDGTAAILAADPGVTTFSMHGRNNFPFRKQRSTIDIELDDGVTGAEYLDRLSEALPRVLDPAPAIVFYQAGVDALATDRLGRLAVSPDGMAARDRMVFEACRARGAAVVVTLGGGYSEPIEYTVEAHARTYLAAMSIASTR